MPDARQSKRERRRLPMKLILASQSPRRRELLAQAGYEFEVRPPADSAECGICSRELPPELVARLAFQKTKDVARRCTSGVVLGADTVAECRGRILGKPATLEHAREMLEFLNGAEHAVYSGLCLWRRPDDHKAIAVEVTRLKMDNISPQQREEYLATGLWEGKAGAFGYQDGLGWIQIIEGSASNVVGLPMERLETMLQEFTDESESTP